MLFLCRDHSLHPEEPSLGGWTGPAPLKTEGMYEQPMNHHISPEKGKLTKSSTAWGVFQPIPCSRPLATVCVLVISAKLKTCMNMFKIGIHIQSPPPKNNNIKSIYCLLYSFTLSTIDYHHSIPCTLAIAGTCC